MTKDLAGLSALVCGASQGLGFGIAEAMAEAGARIGLLSRNAAKLEASAAGLRTRGLDAIAIPGDVGDWASLVGALERFGSPAILVNNAGGPPASDVTKIDPGLWRAQFEIQVMNQMRLTEAVLPGMRRARFGRILSVSSSAVVEPIEGLALSNALRAALAGWMKTLATATARDGITVNTLLPGSFNTARVASLNAAAAKARGITLADIEAEGLADIPVGRLGEPREFGAVAAFLASPRASYVTGQLIRIDGGSTRSL
jgi:3-oxoacyl-[acyl-carrier protein] reductase